MRNFLEKLNNPRVVVGVLVVILLVNGFLLFQQRGPDSPPRPDARQEQRDNAPPRPDPPREPTDSRMEETPEEETTARNEENGENVPPKSDASDDDQDSDSNGSDEDDSNANESGDDGNQNAENQNSDNGGSDNGGDGAAPILVGLTDYVRGCDGETERCIRDYVSEESPESRYIGGRTDLGSESNAEVVYFENPALDVCEYEREVYESRGDREYVVILIGPGSFSSERGDECIPQA